MVTKLSAKVLLVIVAIFLAELTLFLPVAAKVGFYLDDWSIMNELKFGPQGFIASSIHLLICDGRIMIRPLEAPYYSLLYAMFGIHSLGCHLINYGLEITSALLVYFITEMLVQKKFPALTAALFFLLYPIHDATHYWVVASSATLSMVFYLFSLWCMIKACRTRMTVLYLVSLAAYVISVFTYESFAPLCLANLACVYIIGSEREKGGLRQYWSLLVKSILYLLPYLLCIGMFWFYQYHITPTMGHTYLRKIHISPLMMVSTIGGGLQWSISPSVINFLCQQIYWGLRDGISRQQIILLVLSTMTTFAGLWTIANDANENTEDKSRRIPVVLFTLGLLVVLSSYTIFGVNPDYTPTLMTMINRINYGASLGASFMFAGIVYIAKQYLRAFNKVGTILTLVLINCVFGFFILANWGISKPWISSWSVQTNVLHTVKQNSAKYLPGSSLLLANCPTYAMWSPVFDGVWDFQSAIQVILNNHNQKGGVVSERMSITSAGLTDISRGVTCGIYPFNNLYLIDGSSGNIKKITSPEEFIKIESEPRQVFHLSNIRIAQWKQEIAELRSKQTLTN